MQEGRRKLSNVFGSFGKKRIVKLESMYINGDVLEELFLRIPLKSVGRFKSVSKEWKSILE